MRQLSRIVVVFILGIATAQAAPPEGYDFLPLGVAWQTAARENKPMLLYFGRYGCTTCRKMHAEVFTNGELQRRYQADFVLAYVDTESGRRITLANGERTTEMMFASRSRILGTPTFIFFSPDQQALFKKAGFQSIERMNRYHEYITGDHYRDQPLDAWLAAR